MKQFLDDNFLLETSTAEQLYHEIAKDLPVVDFHNHLNPDQLARDIKFENIGQLWVNADPYKHRAMRINGVPEYEITGDAPDKTKFFNWAKTLPHTVGNPLFHWSCLELKRVFGVDQVLSEDNAEEVWDFCNSKLQDKEFSIIGIAKRFNPELLCTSDTIIDDLQSHKLASEKIQGLKVLPSLRGDSILAVEKPVFLQWLNRFSGNSPVENLNDYQELIKNRLDEFVKAGCVLADHALDSGFTFKLPSESYANNLFNKILKEQQLDQKELIVLKSWLLSYLGKEYGKRNWILQLHIGAQRSTSYRLKKLAGTKGGYACIGNSTDIKSLIHFLDSLEQNDQLPRTILYNLNPNDNEMFGSLTGSFSEDGVAGKIQLGPAWWYNDHIDGIEKQLKAVANHTLLSRFIGMTTDSRSILSLSRHEYFRRILCNLLGKWVSMGVLPNDIDLLGMIVRNVSYENSKNWLVSK